MSFAQENGYIPSSITDLMNLVRVGFNTEFGTTYTVDTFLGTNAYKYFYSLIQLLQQNEVKTSEIFAKLQQYFVITNEAIDRPKLTAPGILDALTDAGFVASIKKPIAGDAGKLYVCVDLDSGASDYATKKLQVNTILKDCTAGGVVTQGTETSAITLTNDQSFDFKFTLPTETAILLKATLTLSANSRAVILSDDAIRQIIYDNINARYRLGLNFEPQRYLSVLDAPWCASVLLEYNIGAGYISTVASLAYDALYTFALDDITIVSV